MSVAIPPGERACHCGTPEPTEAIALGYQLVPANAWLRCIKCGGLF